MFHIKLTDEAHTYTLLYEDKVVGTLIEKPDTWTINPSHDPLMSISHPDQEHLLKVFKEDYMHKC